MGVLLGMRFSLWSLVDAFQAAGQSKNLHIMLVIQWERSDLVALSRILFMRPAFHNSQVIDALDQNMWKAGLPGYSRVCDTGIAKDGFATSFYLSLLVTGNSKIQAVSDACRS